MPSKIMVEIDLRNKFGPIRDQGNRPTCLSIASSDLHQYAAGLNEMLSAEWLFYFTCLEKRSSAKTGTNMSDTRKVLKERGQPFESDWPYSKNIPDESSWGPPSTSNELYKTNSKPFNKNLNFLWTSLKKEIPVIISFRTTEGFMSIPHSNANFEIPEKLDPHEPELEECHGVIVLVCGLYNNKRVFLIRNSWGTNWGYDGYAWIYEDFLASKILEGFYIPPDANI